MCPTSSELESIASEHCISLIRNNAPSRSLCCNDRKVWPPARKLKEFQAYMVGLRRDQSESRAGVSQIAHEGHLVKVSPLANWTQEQVEDYTVQNRVPVHPLYAQGYTSIGCAPCTRGIKPGESERSGRWWWEQDADKECGIHFSSDGRAERQVDVLLREVLTGQPAT